ncbi:type IX secretion system outer membrane channel protein PorV [Agriterribacter sp.]|uniref:type IX secretion system outer membrane channel protein PorV n=1 Tax=Agriterribacter sp. TaxID=2821509 RepID=UPI002C821D13|nr:type IX secretion system outer membrane channel protein PorV [Agriterribacter sp.]HTN06947.1 type IX secretion system outer membrane channel protein PorV [Agriterribacter sp.]
MKTVYSKLLMSLSAAFTFSAAAYSQTAERINIVTTSVPFLRVSPDARAGAMGDQGISTSPDANAQFYNVAKYPFIQNEWGIGATYTPWLKDLGLKDVYLASLAAHYKLDEQQVISGALRYFNLGSIQFADALGNELNKGNPREFSLDFGYSRKLADKLSLGVALRYIYSNLASGSSSPYGGGSYKPGNALAGDVGLYYTAANDKGQGWNAGLVMSNLGSKISYTSDATQKNFIPANIGVGAGHTWVTNEVHKISLNGEINKLLVPAVPGAAADSADYAKYNSDGVVDGWMKSFGNNAMAYSLGAEYFYNDQFALRAGYYADSRTLGKRSYFTMGLGINYNIIGLNFSYLLASGNGVNRNPLSNTMRIGLLFNAGGGTNSAKPEKEKLSY